LRLVRILICYTVCVLFLTHRTPSMLYTLSLHDALPIWSMILMTSSAFASTWRLYMRYTHRSAYFGAWAVADAGSTRLTPRAVRRDRKSTRLNSSHGSISYAVFCLKKKKKQIKEHLHTTA